MKLIFQTIIIAGILIQSVISQPEIKSAIAQRLLDHVKVLASDSLEGRGLGTEGKQRAQQYIAEQFLQVGLKPADEDYFQQLNLQIGLVMVQGANVIGYIEGNDPEKKEEYILIGAHYDHLGYRFRENQKVIYHGADDNASGVATLIEIARYFTTHPGLVPYSILFVAFDAEESGLIGSSKFITENKSFDVGKIKVMFSLDMVGMYSANRGLGLKGIGSLVGGESLAKEIASNQDVILKKTSADTEARTDTWPFGNKAIPAVHAYTGTKSPYHKPEDTWEFLDYEGMAKITLYLQSLITGIAALPELSPLPRYVRLHKPEGIKFNFGIKGSAGSAHHRYPDEFYDAKNIFAYGGGLFMQMHLSKRFSLQPEVLYRSDGSKSPEGTFSRQSIAVPVNLHFNFAHEPSVQMKSYVFAGGYFMHSFAGKNGGNKLDLDQLYRDEEWGYNMGLGFDIMDWQLTYCWQQSLTNLSKAEGGKLFPAGWTISLGYKF